MRNQFLTLCVIVAVLVAGLVAASPANANVGPPMARMAFEFFDEDGQPLIPASLQLAGCQDAACTSPVLLYATPRLFDNSFCTLPGCLPSSPDTKLFGFSCTGGNACRVNAPKFGSNPYYMLVILPRSETPLQEAAVGIFESQQLDFGEIRGLRVVVNSSEVRISDDEEIRDRTPPAPNYGYCNDGPTNATIGFLITQVAEILVVLLCLLALGTPHKMIGGILLAVGLINFATYPVVWFTFPALGPFRSSQEAAVAVFPRTVTPSRTYRGASCDPAPSKDSGARS